MQAYFKQTSNKNLASQIKKNSDQIYNFLIKNKTSDNVPMFTQEPVVIFAIGF